MYGMSGKYGVPLRYASLTVLGVCPGPTDVRPGFAADATVAVVARPATLNTDAVITIARNNETSFCFIFDSPFPVGGGDVATTY